MKSYANWVSDMANSIEDTSEFKTSYIHLLTDKDKEKIIKDYKKEIIEKVLKKSNNHESFFGVDSRIFAFTLLQDAFLLTKMPIDPDIFLSQFLIRVKNYYEI